MTDMPDPNQIPAQENEIQFRSIFYNSPVSIEVYDRKGKLVDMNPACESLLGIIEKSSLIGFPLFENPFLDEAAKDQLKRGERAEFEVLYDFDLIRRMNLFKTTRTGVRHLHVMATPTFDGTNGIQSFLVHIYDITARKDAELALQESETKHRRFSADLEEANRMKDLFTDILRHDIISPLTAISISASLLRKFEQNINKLKIIDSIERSVFSISEMAENATNFAKYSSATELDFKLTDISRLLLGIISEFDISMAAKRIKTRVETISDCVIPAHPMLKDVFINLISNAIKYGPPEGIIGIHMEKASETITVCISDQGPGIADACKTRVFNRFERLRKEEVKGSGLGLAIAKRIVELHRGTIRIENNIPKGSIFRVELPRALRK